MWATLLAVTAALWVVVRVLREPPPGLDSGELDTLRENVAIATDSILAERKAAIESLDAAGDVDSLIYGGVGRYVVDGSGFEAARFRAESDLQHDRQGPDISMDGWSLPQALEMDESLDSADEIFRAESVEGTAVSEAELRRTLEAEAPGYIRLLGYNALRQTLGRDLIRYRVLESLRFHELKDTLYHSESDTNKSALYLARQGAYARRDSDLSALDHRYMSYIQVLVHQLNSNWMSEERESGITRAETIVPDDIRARIDGFSRVIGPEGREIEPGSVPASDRWSWLTSETEISTEFEAALDGGTSG